MGSCQKQHFVTDPYPVTDSDRVRQVKQTAHIELAMLTDLEALLDRAIAGDPRHGVHHTTMADLKADSTQEIGAKAVSNHIGKTCA
jgi:hypothetical protein